MRVRFLQRTRNRRTEQVLPAGLQIDVVQYSKSVYGGCDRAEIEIRGNEDRLLELMNTLRCGVEIYDEKGNAVWWGFVQRVEVPRDKVKVVADLEEMSNKVAVAYNLISAGGNTVGLRRTSPWIADEDSLAKFGIKELLESGGSMSSVEAVSMATRLRNAMAFPRVYVVEGDDEAVAKIECLGWWHTLGWRYCFVPTELALSFQTVGSASVELREGVKVAQTFKATSDINLAEIELFVSKVGGPGNINITLNHVGEDGKPGGQIRHAVIDSHNIKTEAEWVRCTLNETVVLKPKKSYFLVMESAWSPEGNYQVISLDPNNGYGDGTFYEFVEDEWVETEKDMPFRLYNNVLTETSQQIQNYLTDSGQFFSGVFINDRSGHYAESYRSGDTTALTEAESLLEVGTSNYRRLLARVAADMAVEVWEEPEEPIKPDLEMRPDGRVYFRAGNFVGEHFDPTGKWVSIEPVVLGNLGNATFTGAQSFFCDAVEWTPDEGMTLTPANWRNPLDLRIKNG